MTAPSQLSPGQVVLAILAGIAVALLLTRDGDETPEPAKAPPAPSPAKPNDPPADDPPTSDDPPPPEPGSG